MVTAIELLAAAQALDYRAPLAPGRGVREAHGIVRSLVEPLTADRSMSGDIEKLVKAVVEGKFDSLLN
jgi:histidine ammonia-lyase